MKVENAKKYDARMKLCKYVASFSLLVLYSFVSCSAKNMKCFWVMDAVQKDNLMEVASIIVPGGQYFLRIRVTCNDMVKVSFLISLTCYKHLYKLKLKQL